MYFSGWLRICHMLNISVKLRGRQRYQFRRNVERSSPLPLSQRQFPARLFTLAFPACTPTRPISPFGTDGFETLAQVEPISLPLMGSEPIRRTTAGMERTVRDDIIEKVRRGEMTPPEAEAE